MTSVQCNVNENVTETRFLASTAGLCTTLFLRHASCSKVYKFRFLVVENWCKISLNDFLIIAVERRKGFERVMKPDHDAHSKVLSKQEKPKGRKFQPALPSQIYIAQQNVVRRFV